MTDKKIDESERTISGPEAPAIKGERIIITGIPGEPDFRGTVTTVTQSKNGTGEWKIEMKADDTP